jgi:hypothetical protein
MVVTLTDFWLSDWFPLRPGRFHTDRGRMSRDHAQRHLLSGPGADPRALERFEMALGHQIPRRINRQLREGATPTKDAVYIYDPDGKAKMLDGVSVVCG